MYIPPPKPSLRLALLTALSIFCAHANAAPAQCLRSALLLVCVDEQGNHYSVRSDGAHTYVRGNDLATGRRWAQTNSRYGTFTLFSGLASDGEVWTGKIQKVGWTTLTSVARSSGGVQRMRCSPLTGCTAPKSPVMPPLRQQP